MDFRPSSDRAIRVSGMEREGSAPFEPRRDDRHDFDAPALGGPPEWRRPSASRPAPARLIDLERRARFARLPLEWRQH